MSDASDKPAPCIIDVSSDCQIIIDHENNSKEKIIDLPHMKEILFKSTRQV